MSILERYKIDDPERGRRQLFLGLTEEDAANVRALRAVFADHAEAFAERFYQHLLASPHTASFLRDPEQLAELKILQANYFLELLEGRFDSAYYEGRLRVGQAHQRIGLEPVWYLGAYNQYVQLTFPIFARAFGDNLERVLPYLLSLMKVIFLDIGLALRTYFQEATEQLRRHNEELQQALNLYWQTQRREEQLRKLLSHEIRGGLAAMITSLEDLLEVTRSSLDAAALDQLENVSRRGWSLSNLLGEMLAKEKGSSGPGWTETGPIFDSLVARFALYREGRAIQLDLPEHPPRVWADSLQLREVFANLTSNAVRYLDKEPGRIAISCRTDGNFYLFCVADNGPGIPANVRERLFEPFVRGPLQPGRPQGTGLGLYFVRTVVEQGGGRIWVDSEPGQGSRFWFTVPRLPPANSSPPPDTRSVVPD
ncbi:MAG TPA: protoglobin domain-containing protein [Gemmataceae bacterium]|jgi:signal transduction histidine kinase|nr:protoglobin domain-containing protein [Gemmataceae bacterium]